MMAVQFPIVRETAAGLKAVPVAIFVSEDGRPDPYEEALELHEAAAVANAVLGVPRSIFYRVEGVPPGKPEQASAQLAAALVAAAELLDVADDDFLPAFRGPLWATGAFVHGARTLREMDDAAASPAKLRAFIASEDAQLMVGPASLMRVIARHHDLAGIHVVSLDALAAQRYEHLTFWGQHRKVFAAIGHGDEQFERLVDILLRGGGEHNLRAVATTKLAEYKHPAECMVFRAVLAEPQLLTTIAREFAAKTTDTALGRLLASIDSTTPAGGLFLRPRWDRTRSMAKELLNTSEALSRPSHALMNVPQYALAQDHKREALLAAEGRQWSKALRFAVGSLAVRAPGGLSLGANDRDPWLLLLICEIVVFHLVPDDELRVIPFDLPTVLNSLCASRLDREIQSDALLLRACIHRAFGDWRLAARDERRVSEFGSVDRRVRASFRALVCELGAGLGDSSIERLSRLIIENPSTCRALMLEPVVLVAAEDVARGLERSEADIRGAYRESHEGVQAAAASADILSLRATVATFAVRATDANAARLSSMCDETAIVQGQIVKKLAWLQESRRAALAAYDTARADIETKKEKRFLTKHQAIWGALTCTAIVATALRAAVGLDGALSLACGAACAVFPAMTLFLVWTLYLQSQMNSMVPREDVTCGIDQYTLELDAVHGWLTRLYNSLDAERQVAAERRAALTGEADVRWMIDRARHHDMEHVREFFAYASDCIGGHGVLWSPATHELVRRAKELVSRPPRPLA